MCNFHYLGYYCSPNLSIHQNSTQELTWNFLVTLAFIKAINVAEGEKIKITVLQNQMDFFHFCEWIFSAISNLVLIVEIAFFGAEIECMHPNGS